MISFFRCTTGTIIAVKSINALGNDDIQALQWLFSGAEHLGTDNLKGYFAGPRREMITPWSTTATEITHNMNIEGIVRMEEYFPVSGPGADIDKMLQRLYNGLDQEIFTTDNIFEPVRHITDLERYNIEEGLALSEDEIGYLHDLSDRIGRPLTDSEVFGFSQVNSEHCRHKIFNGTFIIDGKEMPSSLFNLIKKTSKLNPGRIVSAYKDNCAFVEGPCTPCPSRIR